MSMSLFSVTRYTGEDETSALSKETELLKKLNERSLKRKLGVSRTVKNDKEPTKKKLKLAKEKNPKLLKSRKSTSGKQQKEKISGENKDCSEAWGNSSSDTNSDESLDSSKETVKKLEHRENVSAKPDRIKSCKDHIIKGKSEGSYVNIEPKHEVNTEPELDVNSEPEQDVNSAPKPEVNTEPEQDVNSEPEQEVSGENHVSSELEPESFTVLGDVFKKKAKKVNRVLPQWLSEPSVVKSDIRHNTTPVSELPGIDLHLRKKLQENNIESFFPVQAQVMPVLLEGTSRGFVTGKAGYRPCDICCSAPTGSGKTLAYVLPIVQALKSRVTCQVRALVLLPVGDLAIQVFNVFNMYCQGTPLKVAAVTGTKPLKQEREFLVKKRPHRHGYDSCVDIVVATPGRLVDHIQSTPGFVLKHLRYLVIDEADRMIEEIKQDWLPQVERCVYGEGRPRPGPLTANNMAANLMPLQKLLFSATLSQNPEQLQQLGLFQPRLFTSIVTGTNLTSQNNELEATAEAFSEESRGEFIGKFTTPGGLTERFVQCSPSEKPLTVLYLLHQLKFRRVLCFTNSVQATHRLYWLLKVAGGDIVVKEFSSKLHKSRRGRLLRQFEEGKVDVLICSDAMARGMDVDNVKYVVSYDSAPFLKTYIHRVGRTARAGRVGTAITLLERKEVFGFKKMTKEVGKTVKEMKMWKADLKPYIPMLENALKKLPEILESEKQSLKK